MHQAKWSTTLPCSPQFHFYSWNCSIAPSNPNLVFYILYPSNITIPPFSIWNFPNKVCNITIQPYPNHEIVRSNFPNFTLPVQSKAYKKTLNKLKGAAAFPQPSGSASRSAASWPAVMIWRRKKTVKRCLVQAGHSKHDAAAWGGALRNS